MLAGSCRLEDDEEEEEESVAAAWDVRLLSRLMLVYWGLERPPRDPDEEVVSRAEPEVELELLEEVDPLVNWFPPEFCRRLLTVLGTSSTGPGRSPGAESSLSK